MPNTSDNISGIIEEVFFVEVIKSKIKRGEELTAEDKEKLLNTIYKAAINNIRDMKQSGVNKTGTRVALSAVSIIFRLSGKGKGLSTATKALNVGFKDRASNQKELIKGITLTDRNPVIENFTTLIAQYDASEEYDSFLINLYDKIQELINSYKSHYDSPVAPDDIKGMNEAREKVVTLGKKYIYKG